MYYFSIKFVARISIRLQLLLLRRNKLMFLSCISNQAFNVEPHGL